jgi:hypothetical protein
MFDTTKEISEQAKRFIVTAAKIPADSEDFAVAVSYIAQGPVTVDRDGYFQPVPCAELNAEGMSLLELMLRAADDGADDFRQFMDEEKELHNKAMRIQMIRAFEFPIPKGAFNIRRWFNRLLAWKHKRQWAESLKRLEADI